MLHNVPLIAILAVGLAVAFFLGFVAARLRLPPLIGYLLAGIAVGPHTPGFVGDMDLAGQLAEIGVILLMFGVGMHFSVRDLMAVRGIAVPGAVAQIAVAVVLGAAAAATWGWSLPAGIVFGLALSVASTVVLLRALEQRGAVTSLEGRIAVGWLIVEDVAMVIALVLLPVLADGGAAARGLDLAIEIGLLLAKISLFFVVMHYVGIRFFPGLFSRVAATGSRELLTLFVIAVALGIAYGSALLLGVSFALGAFFAGVVINESQLSKRVAAEAVPLENAFAVLFFVSVGMLFDPQILVTKPLEVLTVVAIVLFGKSVAALLIVLAFRYPLRAALTVSAALAQIGEFSFILAALGVSMGLLEPEAQSLILAGALLSITLNPAVFATIGPLERFLRSRPGLSAVLTRWQRLPDEVLAPVTLRDHVVLAGYGRVGHSIAARLRAQNVPFVVIEQNREALKDLEGSNVPFVFGDATNKEILARARPEHARLLILATPDVLQAKRVLELVREVNPKIDSAVRTHSEEELAFVRRMDVGIALMGEQELARGLTKYALSVYEREPPERAAGG
ncbi:MAG TPA: cation:proton antiporter [Steroidobacteraceae bacterium]|nr:cation:proton antiporter [Steroidobacteraceae bacterium]